MRLFLHNPERGIMVKQIQKMTVKSILDYIDKLLDEGTKIDISTVSAYSGYSSRHIQRLFRDETGMPMGDYVRRRRLTRAAFLVRMTKRSFSDIAFSLGFDSQQTFNREFKKVIGCTPKEYRYNEYWPFTPLTPQISDYRPEILSSGIVFLEKRFVLAHEMVSWGCLPCTRQSDSFNQTLDIIFASVGCNAKSTCVISRIKGINHEEFTHRIFTYLESENGEKTIFSDEGRYMSFSFYTDRENHMRNIQAIHMDMLNMHKIERRDGCNIELFRKQNEQVLCDLYIPVME